MTNQVRELDNHPRRQNQRIVDDEQFLAELRAMGQRLRQFLRKCSTTWSVRSP